MGEDTPARPPIRLHAVTSPRTVVLADDDGDVTAIATKRLATLLDDPPAVFLTGSCTASLEATAAALELAAGDEVVVPAFTFPTAAAAFAARGATVRFADVDPTTGNLDPDDVDRCLGPRTRAVVAMHYAGVAADLGAVTPGLAARGIDVIEDAAQGLFASLDGAPLGTFGRFGAISFHRTKNVSTIDGGALVVNHPDDVERVRVLLDKGTDRHAFEDGSVPAYQWRALGSAWRMHQAGVHLLAAELEVAAAGQVRRHAAWDRYVEGLSPWAVAHGVGLPMVGPGREHPAHLFFLVLPEAEHRSAFIAHLASAGVQSAWHYGSLPDSAMGRSIAHPDDTCPKALDFAARVVRIPLHQDLSGDDVDRVIEAVTAWSGPTT
jgi:dTDP-4-amino-4,6-dideoxygalactose transaminase